VKFLENRISQKIKKVQFEAKIFDGQSIKDRWHELIMVNIGGVAADDMGWLAK